MRRWLAPACFLLVLSPSAVALADGDCPPGSWFCEEANVKPPPQAKQQQEAEEQADEQETATTPQDAPLPKKKKHHKKTSADAQQGVELHTQGPIVIYTQGQPIVQGEAPQAAPALPLPPPPPSKKKRRWRERFGMNLRGEGAAFTSAYGGTAAMGGVGMSFRYRPVPAFALDVGGDILGGKDYYHNSRIESAFSLTGMLYLNPGSRVQVYGLGGMNLTHAEIDTGNRNGFDSMWSSTMSHDYIGGHAGAGIEFRVSRHIGLGIDGVGLLRHRIDGGAPEFRDPKTGNTTDTAGAGLFRGGITFWW